MGHTPGPWSVSNGNLLRVTDTKNSPVVICGVHLFGKHGGRNNGGDPLANARLIAAAPDLLEALKDIVNGVGAEFGPRCTEVNFPKAIAAIAKAEAT